MARPTIDIADNVVLARFDQNTTLFRDWPQPGRETGRPGPHEQASEHLKE